MKSRRIYLLLIACLFTRPLHALPEVAFTSFTFENDLFTGVGNDRHYTGGLRLSYASKPFAEFNDDNTYPWMRKLFGSMNLFRREDYQRSIAYGVGQMITTPEDLSIAEPQPDDLPYAGLLYGYFALNGQRSKHAETLSMMVGVVGPLSLGEQTQKGLHYITNSDQPKGWDNQLKNEPVVNLSYDRRYLLHSRSLSNQWSMDVVGSAAVHLGNAITGACLSFALVIGHEGSYNPLSIRPDISGRGSIGSNSSSRSGPFILIGGGTDHYLHSVFLDGNTFRDSPSVEKESMVYNRFLGFGYNWTDMSVHIGWFDQSELFKGQREGLEYGTLNITWHR